MTVRVNVVLTAVFVVVTALAVTIFDGFWRRSVVVVDLALFAVGVVTFILGYFAAVARSRSEEISVVGTEGKLEAFLPSSIVRRGLRSGWRTGVSEEVVIDERPGEQLAQARTLRVGAAQREQHRQQGRGGVSGHDQTGVFIKQR